MIEYRTVKKKKHLEQILTLQAKNHRSALNLKEKEANGFVTVKHTIEELEIIHAGVGHTAALYEDCVIGYTLTMDASSKTLIPILFPMFDLIETSSFNGVAIKNEPYVVMGQVCIDADFRGKGVFRSLYAKMAETMQEHYKYIITEISKDNTRSLGAHFSVGFKELIRHGEWVMVILPVD